jgi:hypothetical protein
MVPPFATKVSKCLVESKDAKPGIKTMHIVLFSPIQALVVKGHSV